MILMIRLISLSDLITLTIIEMAEILLLFYGFPMPVQDVIKSYYQRYTVSILH